LKILIRLDAGKKYGLGHLTRNIYLADKLLFQNITSVFLIKSDDKYFVNNFLIKRGITINVHYLKDKLTDTYDLNKIFKITRSLKINSIIVDHYQVSMKYFKSIKSKNITLINYDVFLKKNLYTDMIINSNIGFEEANYLKKYNKNAIKCIGSKYLIINPELKKTHVKNIIKNKILISFGGGEYPLKIQTLIDKITNNFDYEFIVFSNDTKVKKIDKANTKIYSDNIDYNLLLSEVRFAIVSGGTSSQELAFLNIPMFIYPFNLNHKKTALGLLKNQLAIKVNYYQCIDINYLISFKYNPKIKLDNKGTTRLSKKIKQLLIKDCIIYGRRINLRPMRLSDTDKIVKWRNESSIMKWMKNQNLITKDSHIKWFKNRNKRLDFIIEEKKNKKSIGTVNLIFKSKNRAELGKLIGEKNYLGKGFASESFRLLIDFSFKELNLEKLIVYTKVNNFKNINLNSRLGFKVDESFKNISNDTIQMSISKYE